METNNYTEIERKISVKDLVKYVLKKVKLIAVCTLVCALVFGILGGVVLSVSDNKEVDVESLKEELTEQELSDLEYCQSIEAMMRQSKEYYEKSLLLNSDLNNIARGEIIFYAQTENNELSNDIVNMYVLTLSSQDMYEKLLKELGEQVTVKDLDAMLDYSYLGTYAEKAGGVFKVIIKAPTKEMYEVIKNIITTHYAEYSNTLNATVVKHDLLVLSDSVEVNVDERLIEEKYNLLSNIERLESQRDSLQDSMVTAAKDIYEDWEANTYPGEDDEEESNSIIIFVLFVAIGIVIGVCLPVCYLVASYLLNGKLKTARELNDYYGIHNLASIREISNKEWESVACKLALACKSKDVARICLIKPENDLCKDGIEYVVRALEAKGIQTKLVENPAFDGVSLEECNTVKMAVLWVKLWNTKEADVVEILKASKAYGFDVMGYVSEIA